MECTVHGVAKSWTRLSDFQTIHTKIPREPPRPEKSVFVCVCVCAHTHMCTQLCLSLKTSSPHRPTEAAKMFQENAKGHLT